MLIIVYDLVPSDLQLFRVTQVIYQFQTGFIYNSDSFLKRLEIAYASYNSCNDYPLVCDRDILICRLQTLGYFHWVFRCCLMSLIFEDLDLKCRCHIQPKEILTIKWTDGSDLLSSSLISLGNCFWNQGFYKLYT